MSDLRGDDLKDSLSVGAGLGLERVVCAVIGPYRGERGGGSGLDFDRIGTGLASVSNVPEREFVISEWSAVGFTRGDGELKDGTRIARGRVLENAPFGFEVRIRRMREIEISEPVAGAAAACLEFAIVTKTRAVVNTECVEVPVGKQIGLVADK